MSLSTWRAVLVAVLVLVVVAVVASRVGSAEASLAAGPFVVGCSDADVLPGALRVMAYNLWGGGLAGGYPLERSAQVITQVDPHIVAIQERSYQEVDRLPQLAALAGMTLVDKASILTTLPVIASWRLFGPDTHTCGAAELRMPDGASVFVYNVHLQSYPYGPHAVRDGQATSAIDAARVEAPRVAQMKEILADMDRSRLSDARVVLLGDFNTPSHRDWAVPTARTYGLAVRWPVTVHVERAGFADAYRAIHPDPVDRITPRGTTVPGRPGFTYSPVVRADNDHIPSDRIDMIFARGPGLRICDTAVVGEEGSDIVSLPWPSDHRAVLSHLHWDP